MEELEMSSPLKELTEKWAPKSKQLKGDDLWELDKEVRDVMDTFRREYAIKEANAIRQSEEIVITF